MGHRRHAALQDVVDLVDRDLASAERAVGRIERPERPYLPGRAKARGRNRVGQHMGGREFRFGALRALATCTYEKMSDHRVLRPHQLGAEPTHRDEAAGAGRRLENLNRVLPLVHARPRSLGINVARTVPPRQHFLIAPAFLRRALGLASRAGGCAGFHAPAQSHLTSARFEGSGVMADLVRPEFLAPAGTATRRCGLLPDTKFQCRHSGKNCGS